MSLCLGERSNLEIVDIFLGKIAFSSGQGPRQTFLPSFFPFSFYFNEKTVLLAILASFCRGKVALKILARKVLFNNRSAFLGS